MGNACEDELFIEEESIPSYWSCSVCTYNNSERDMQCSICSSPFKSTTKSTNQYTSDILTFGDYLPPILDSLVNLEDDMDQSIQFAIMLSYDNYTPPSTNPNTHLYAKSHVK